MLTWNTVLDYLRQNVSLPSTFIENNDNQIKEWVKTTALREFSNYFPDWERTCVITNNSHYKHPLKRNQFLFYDEGGCDIISIRECYFSMNTQVLTGHPFMGPWTFEGTQWWALNVFKSRFFAPFSMWSYTYKFVPPNIVEVLPEIQDENFLVEYERTQPSDLHKIPVATEMAFMDLALAHFMIKIGRLRMHYGGNIDTPFGQIPLNGEMLKTDGETLRKEVVDTMINESLPPVIIDVY